MIVLPFVVHTHNGFQLREANCRLALAHTSGLARCYPTMRRGSSGLELNHDNIMREARQSVYVCSFLA